MEVLRKVGQFQLNMGGAMARGLYNVTNSILVDNTEDEGVSFWFGSDTKDLLLIVSDSEFVSRAKQMCGNDINDYV